MVKRSLMITVFTVLLSLMVIGVWTHYISRIEEPKYHVVTLNNNIEFRCYNSLTIAEVIISGDRKSVINKGFRILADYIFGNNKSNTKIAMTAPVMQFHTSTIIKDNAWAIAFVMPNEYQYKNLPAPYNQEIKFKKIRAKKFLAIKFSGNATDGSIKNNEDKLFSYLGKNNFIVIFPAIYAFYNPPWTLPFLKRNEVIIEVE